MEKLKTMYGELHGVLRYDTYFGGQPYEVELREENIIVTDYGTFVPQYKERDSVFERTKKNRSSIVFHENGEVKSIALEAQTLVDTPCGKYPAELITFYDDGSLNRVFPLNGQINGYWSEEDEGTLAEDYGFVFGFGSFASKLISLRFYDTGELKSLTLWPGSVINLDTPVGPMAVRTGFALYKDGRLKSVEPAKPKAVHTKIGSFLAYDNDALGIHADSGSIKFDEAGKVIKLTTAVNGVEVTHGDGIVVRVVPREVASYVDVTETVILPLKVTFDKEHVTIDNGIRQKFIIEGHKFKVYFVEQDKRAGCTDCNSCDGSDACGS